MNTQLQNLLQQGIQAFENGNFERADTARCPQPERGRENLEVAGLGAGQRHAHGVCDWALT